MRRRQAPWPETWSRGEVAANVAQRVLYHGIAGLLIERCDGLAEWPRAVRDEVRQAAVAQAMWEMRHKQVVAELLADLAREGILAIVLKGTAFAYNLYDIPANRARGDTDILIDRADLEGARVRLVRAGFRFDAASDGIPESLRLQEVWVLSTGGLQHEIDLHWAAVNSHALNGMLTFEDCSAGIRDIPALGKGAHAMDGATALVHACIHRAQHLVSPYIVNGVAFYGGDRLIWFYDIHLLGATLTADDWSRLCDMALHKGLAEVCLDGLLAAQECFGVRVPAHVVEALQMGRAGRAATYLYGSGQMGRAWMDLRAVRGWRGKITYFANRTIPPAKFMRAKYPDWAHRSLALLYFRRLAELWRDRSRASGR